MFQGVCWNFLRPTQWKTDQNWNYFPFSNLWGTQGGGNDMIEDASFRVLSWTLLNVRPVAWNRVFLFTMSFYTLREFYTPWWVLYDTYCQYFLNHANTEIIQDNWRTWTDSRWFFSDVKIGQPGRFPILHTLIVVDQSGVKLSFVRSYSSCTPGKFYEWILYSNMILALFSQVSRKHG